MTIRGRGFLAAWLLSVFLSGCASAPRMVKLGYNYADASLFGDSSAPLSREQLSSFEALTAKKPRAWARYICNYNSATDITLSEFDLYQSEQLRLILSIEPGQPRLLRGRAEGLEDAKCVADKIQTLKRSKVAKDVLNNAIFMLDVEDKLKDDKTPVVLSGAYLKGLLDGLIDHRVIEAQTEFGVYLLGASSAGSRRAVNQAIAAGYPITYAWFARYPSDHSCGPSPFWVDNNGAELVEVDAARELWQYAQNCRAVGTQYKGTSFDLNMLKPASLASRYERRAPTSTTPASPR